MGESGDIDIREVVRSGKPVTHAGRHTVLRELGGGAMLRATAPPWAPTRRTSSAARRTTEDAPYVPLAEKEVAVLIEYLGEMDVAARSAGAGVLSFLVMEGRT